MKRQWAGWCVGGAVALIVGWPAACSVAAEKSAATIQVELTISSGSVLYTDRIQREPPAIVIDFHSRNVVAELETAVPVAAGILREIRTEYYPRPTGKRPLKSLTLVLTQPTSYAVRQSPTSIIIELATPTSRVPGRLNVGKGMTILGIEGRDVTLKRLEAMGTALQEVSSAPQAAVQPKAPVVISRPVQIPQPIAASQPPAAPGSKRGGIGFWLGLLLGGSGVWMFRRHRRQALTAPAPVAPASATPTIPFAGTTLEQLVLGALQRQGQQVVRTTPIASVGTLWVMQHDQTRHGVLCVGDGQFLERKILEQFYWALRQEGLKTGTVFALGQFTAPALILAKEHQIALVVGEEFFKLIASELKAPVPTPHVERPTQQTEHPLSHQDPQASTEPSQEAEPALAQTADATSQTAAQADQLNPAREEQAHPQAASEPEPMTIEEVEQAMEHHEEASKPLEEMAAPEATSSEQEVAAAAGAPESPPTSEHPERRKWPRFELAALAERGLLVRVDTTNGSSPSVIGMVKNVGRGGFMAEVDREVASEGSVKVELCPFDSMVLIEAVGEVVWKKQYEDGKVRIGIYIDAISKQDQNRLVRYLKTVEGMVAASVSTIA